jgi:hypothetical protein
MAGVDGYSGKIRPVPRLLDHPLPPPEPGGELASAGVPRYAGVCILILYLTQVITPCTLTLEASARWLTRKAVDLYNGSG